MNVNDRQLWLETAQTAALQAGQFLREQWRQPRQLSSKGFRDWVTDADIASQRIITDLIRSRYRDHGFLGEEENPALPIGGPVIWVIDPVDGTSNYSRQQPNFSISIAAAVHRAGDVGQGAGEPASTVSAPVDYTGYQVQVGIIYDPLRDEMFSAAAGEGSQLNGQSLQVSQIADLAQAIVGLDWGHQYEKREAMLKVLAHFAHEVHTLRAIGSAALALAWVAAGRLDGYLQMALGPWDAAAGSLLIQEAGGQFTTLAGQPWTLLDRDCLASNRRLHHRLLSIFPVASTIPA